MMKRTKQNKWEQNGIKAKNDGILSQKIGIKVQMMGRWGLE